MTRRLSISALCLLLSAFALSAASLTARRTWWQFGEYFPANSLGYALNTNYSAITNTLGGNHPGATNYSPEWETPWLGNNQFQYGTTNCASWTLNSNSVFYRKRGVTSLCVAMPDDNAGGNHVCLVTRRHAIGIQHFGTNWVGKVVWFMNTNGVVSGHTIAAAMFDADTDYEVFQFAADLPANIETMRVAGPLPTNTFPGKTAGLVPAGDNIKSWKGFMYCQHGFIGFAGETHPSGTFNVGGDSGSPGFILLGDELINTGGTGPGPIPSVPLQSLINTLCTNTGLDSASYQMETFALTNFAAWPHP